MNLLLPIVGSVLAVVAGVVVALTGNGDIRMLGWFLLGIGVFFLTVNLAMRKMAVAAVKKTDAVPPSGNRPRSH